MDFNSLKFFLDNLMANLWELELDNWVVTSLGSGRRNDKWCWTICLKNNKTHEEKIIRIPCYKD